MNPSATPSLATVIAQGVHWVLDGVHTAMPGKVVAVKDGGFVNVLPTLKRAMLQGEAKAFPVVNNVPLMWPTTQDGGLRLPVKAGDPVLLVVSERSLERWKDSGDTATADDGAHFQLKDAVAIPGLWGKGNAYTPKGDATSAELAFKNSRVELKASGAILATNGTVSLKLDGNKVTLGSNTVEVLALLKELLEAFRDMKTTNAVVGSPCLLSPDDIVKVQAIITKLGTLQ